MSVNHRCGRLIHPALEVDLLTMGENSVKRGNREKPYVILNDINYAGIQINKQRWSSLESRCAVNNRGIRDQDRNTIIWP